MLLKEKHADLSPVHRMRHKGLRKTRKNQSIGYLKYIKLPYNERTRMGINRPMPISIVQSVTHSMSTHF